MAYTVFEGTQPEAMDVEILGVLKNVLGPGQDMILARLQGSKPEYTGVVAGMSGSPVYIDGKLLGALSYRIGQFSKEPIAGITPIAEMLAINGTDEPQIVAPGARDSAMWTPEAEKPPQPQPRMRLISTPSKRRWSSPASARRQSGFSRTTSP